MAALNGKFHIKIGDFGFLIARGARTERHIYTRNEAPAFVNKFSSGDPNYRDATFFPHWVQLNFINGFNQEFFEDGGKYYRSSSVDPTVVQKLTLQKKFSLAGTTVSSIPIRTQSAWRAAAVSFFGLGTTGTKTVVVSEAFNAANGYLIDANVTAGANGSTSLNATNAGFIPGQQILIHKSRGTGSGVYQKNKIVSYSSGIIVTQDPLNADYSTSGPDVAQVLVLKEYQDFTVNSGITLSADPFDGLRGGIIAFLALGTITVTGTISGNGAGYHGGVNGTNYGNNGVGQQGEGTAGLGISSGAQNGNGGGGSGPRASNEGGNHGAGGGNGVVGNNGNPNGTSPDGGVLGVGGAVVGNAALTLMNFGGGGGGGGFGDHNPGGSIGDGGRGGAIIFLSATTITVTGGITSNGAVGLNASGDVGAGGGGGGGSILLKAQTAGLGSTLVVALAGNGGTGGGSGGAVGGNGRVHLDYLTSFTGTTSPTLDSTQDGTLLTIPEGTNYTHIIGSDNGKIYSWDGASAYTEMFDTRRLTWFESDINAAATVGDVGGSETAAAQSFQFTVAQEVKAIEVYLKLNTGTPGAIEARIETDNSNAPSGTLVDPLATTTIPAFTSTSYAWKLAEFTTKFSLNGSTKYWLVLKMAAGSNDNYYDWGIKGTSGYANGQLATSTDGGSSWSAQTKDAYFRILGSATAVNCSIVSDISGTQKMYFGTGNRAGIVNGEARIYSYDGLTFALVKTFNTTNESSVLSMAEYGTTRRMYIGLGHKAKIYSTSDMSSFTISKTITVPNSPGYVFSLKEYNGKLYAGGGFPEKIYNNNNQYSGFLYSYDEFSWIKVSDFEHTVVTSLEVFDTLLFIGTIKKRLYVFNTASVDKLFEFPWDLMISDMCKWDDKLAIATIPTPGSNSVGQEGVYLFDRNGFHNAFNAVGRTWYSIFVFNNNLMGGNDDGGVYQTSSGEFQGSGTLQTSYEEASLPSIQKLRRSVTVQYEALPEGCSIVVEYKTDESDAAWLPLGTANTPGATESTFNFGTGIYSKKITFRLTLSTTLAASSPTLKKILHKYVLSPDFKYIWKIRLACVDNLVWQDDTEPVGMIKEATTVGQTSLQLVSNQGDFTPTAGFIDPNGAPMYASIIDPNTGEAHVFTYTGKTSTTLTGIPAVGQYSLTVHAVNSKVKITGANLHKKILDLKQARQLFTLTDIDGLTYTVLFHQYESDSWVINQDDFYGGLENEVPITLLEA